MQRERRTGRDPGSGRSTSETRRHARVTSGLEQYTSVAASRDGRRLVATVARPRRTCGPRRARSARRRSRHPACTPYRPLRALAPRLAARRCSICPVRGPSTAYGGWTARLGSLERLERGAVRAARRVAGRTPCRCRRQTRRESHLVIMSADGTDSRTLAASIGYAEGQRRCRLVAGRYWIVAGGTDAQGPALFKIPVDGGEPIRLVDGQGVNPVFSPDGNLIVYAGPLVAGQAALLGVRPDGAPVALPKWHVRQGGYRFLPDGTGLVSLPTAGRAISGCSISRRRATRQLTRFRPTGACCGRSTSRPTGSRSSSKTSAIIRISF